jgi:outer membrane protein assembly factor BamB
MRVDRSSGTAATLLALVLAASLPARAADWPQFRGPNGSGVSEEELELPVKFGPSDGVVWSTALPTGISSPVIAGGRIYLTAFRDKDLLTLALDPAGGKVLWERRAPAEKIEEVHSTSSPAAPSPAADGEGVVVFFGSFGLLAYDRDGKELWQLSLGPFKNTFGSGSSPILTGDLAVLNCDQDQGSFLIAVDRKSGQPRWRAERPEFPRGFSTPLVLEEGGLKEVLVAGTLRLKAYSVKDGRELWSADGLARIVNLTPVLGEGLLYVASFSPGGDSGERIAMPPFDEYLAQNDKDKDGRLSPAEVPAGEMKNRFPQIDADKDGLITRAEWDRMARIFDAARNGILAIRPGGAAGPAQMVWRFERAIPYVPSPIYYRGRIYMVKDGGICTSLEAATGKVAKQERLPAGGGYYASPVAGAGNIYLASLSGEVTVLSAGPTWEVRATNALGERCAATPAISGGRLYLRTERRLFAFAAPPAIGKKIEGAGR